VQAPAPRWSETITYKWARRIAVAVIGGTVCLIGVAMIVLPGPAFVVIPIGLGILGLEFAWARRWLARVRKAANGFVDGMKDYYPWRKPGPGGPKPPGA